MQPPYERAVPKLLQPKSVHTWYDSPALYHVSRNPNGTTPILYWTCHSTVWYSTGWECSMPPSKSQTKCRFWPPKQSKHILFLFYGRGNKEFARQITWPGVTRNLTPAITARVVKSPGHSDRCYISFSRTDGDFAGHCPRTGAYFDDCCYWMDACFRWMNGWMFI